MFHLKKPIRVTKKQQESFLHYVSECGYDVNSVTHADLGLITYSTNHPYYIATPLAETVKNGNRYTRYIFVRL